jgi:hypothetical protein
MTNIIRKFQSFKVSKFQKVGRTPLNLHDQVLRQSLKFNRGIGREKEGISKIEDRELRTFKLVLISDSS